MSLNVVVVGAGVIGAAIAADLAGGAAPSRCWSRLSP
jgi:glycine/D-amino acid oxidase-like deaminating enzyme